MNPPRNQSRAMAVPDTSRARSHETKVPGECGRAAVTDSPSNRRGPRVEYCPECGAWLDTRSGEQNKKLHAMLSELAHRKQWAGKWLDVEAWKRLVIAAYCRAVQQQAEMYPALDGAGFDVVYRRSSRMSKKEMIAVIDWLTAWCAEQGLEIY